jgi:2-acylglycerol O-acyltransferase 2
MFNADFMRTVGTKVHWMIDPSLRQRNPGFRVMADGYLGEDRELVSCDSATFKKHMSLGNTVAFEPGGFLDAVAFEYGKDITVLSDRKAFIKLCLQFGYRVHPCYTFGECDTYTTFTPFRALRMMVARKGVPCLAFFGFPLIPFLPWTSSSILTYIGCGIDFPKIEAPSASEIDQWHSLYQIKLRELFDNYKAEVGKPDAQLEIL